MCLWRGRAGEERRCGNRTTHAHPFLTPLQFLRDRDLDVDETIAKLRRYLAWRADVKPHEVREEEGCRKTKQSARPFFPSTNPPTLSP